MSILRSLGRLAGQGLKAWAGAVIPGAGPIMMAASAANAARRGRMSAAQSPALELVRGGYNPMIGSRAMSMLPAIAGVAGRVVRGGGAILRSPVGRAVTGGAAGAAIYDAAGNLLRGRPGRRKRAKGITGRELKSFVRVTGLLNKYCKTPPPTKRRGASKGKICR